MTNNRQNPSVVIIGAGMTGILLAIKLKEAGITNITVLEKKESIGGTWRENTYPGIACDVPSHAYTYSFEPNPDWSSHFPNGREIHQYFEKVIHKYGVDTYIRYNEAVTSCVYNKENKTGSWTVKTEQGATLQADLLFSATGILHHPVIPNITGRESFTGAMFHTARWDHSVDMKGKRIGVIGTGSSATQVIPQLIGLPGADVSVFQRSPQWIVKMEDRNFTDNEKLRFRNQPWRMKLIRKISAFVYSQGTAALTGDSWFDRFQHRLMTWNAKRYLDSSVKDPELRAKLTPDYKLGCKRVVINSRLYDAIQQPNAHLVTEGIEQIEANGIRTKDGKLHHLDAIVLATGFDAAAFMRPMEFVGKNNMSIEQAWKKKIQAYRSMFLPNFPNFFLMLGPNSPIGNQSVIEISEQQTAYVLQLINQWRAGKLPTIEVKSEALKQWAAMLKARMGKTVWTSGCQSWYLDADGDALAWPDTWNNWLKTMKEPELNDFVISADLPSETSSKPAMTVATCTDKAMI